MSMVDELRPEYFNGTADEDIESDEKLEDKEQDCSYLYDTDDSELEWYQKY